jgi:hypothetical protein
MTGKQEKKRKETKWRMPKRAPSSINKITLTKFPDPSIT